MHLSAVSSVNSARVMSSCVWIADMIDARQDFADAVSRLMAVSAGVLARMEW